MGNRIFIHAAACAALAAPALAQETPVPGLEIELNAAETEDGSCTLSFLVRNPRETDIEAAVFETVLFDAEGQVDRLTLFDFGALPAGRPRVRQFVISGTECGGIGRLLFNGADTCEAGALGPEVCGDLKLTSRTGIEVLG